MALIPNWGARCALIFFLAIVLLPQGRASSVVEKELRDRYSGKTFLIRNFYDSNRLRYDAAGVLTEPAQSGDWTVDGFVELNEISVSDRGFRISGWRVLAGVSKLKIFQFLRYDKDQYLEIDVTVDSGEITVERVTAAISRIFLNIDDHLSEVVPRYWRDCLLNAGKNP